MNISWRGWSWHLGLVSFLATGGGIAFTGNSVLAQITPDTTLGNENSAVTSTGAVDSINGGATRGTNLFHSFQEFNINEGRSAYFNTPDGIENILTRVTGANPSNIFGTLGVSGSSANLFLINPNGIIFGSNARLDVGGSFVGTTANAIGFGDRGVFSATNPSNPELLSVNPSALLFNQIRATSIENSSVADSGLNPSSEFTVKGLRVPNGKQLLLVGGDININGEGLSAFGGRVELGGLASAGTVGLNGEGNNLSLSFPDNLERSNVFLSNGAKVRVTGDAGDVTIKANTFLVKDGAQVSAGTFGAGNGGDLTVDAQDVQVIGRSADDRVASVLATSAQLNSRGDAGNLTIRTNTLLVRDGAQVGVSTRGAGKGGNLSVDAQDVQLIGTSADGRSISGLAAQANSNSRGDAGNLTIRTNTLLVRDGAQVSAGTFGAGNGGDLTVDAQDVQVIGRSSDGQYGSGLFASAQRNSSGNAGDLTIKTNTLLVRDGARVGVWSLGAGTAGNMTLNARSIRLDNDGLLSANTQSASVDPNSEQATININSQDLIMSRNSNIFTNATGENVIGGNINIDTDFFIALENSDISANSANFRGGNVRLDASGIFGAQFRDVASDRTSDVTATGASPELGGTVELNVPEIDPNSGLVNLPVVPVDTQVAQTCTPGGSQQQSEFVVTGRGGLPQNPGESLNTDAVQVDLVTLNSQLAQPSTKAVSTTIFTNLTPTPIVEAQGWAIAANGDVILTASAPTVTPHNSWQTTAHCKS